MPKRQIIEAIENYKTIIIHRHIRPDPDALGSQAGLKLILKETYPGKQVYTVGGDDPLLTFLTKMDEIDDAAYNNALVIVCDTANRPRIDDERYDRGNQLIKIDHHPEVDRYGDIQWVDVDASSVSEMIFELYQDAKETVGWKMTSEAARLLFAGIVGDTGRFMFSSTTEKTFRYAAELVSQPFDREELFSRLYSESEKITRLKGYILSHFTMSEAGFSAVKLSKEKLEEYGIASSETSSLVPVISSTEGILAWVFFIEEDDSIRVRFRSKGPQIHKVAEKYGGGGHPMAAGATITSWAEAEAIAAEMEKLCRKWKQK
jgi:phosphoesterase RecJ-like protein